jgi:hypothetical protein
LTSACFILIMLMFLVGRRIFNAHAVISVIATCFYVWHNNTWIGCSILCQRSPRIVYSDTCTVGMVVQSDDCLL